MNQTDERIVGPRVEKTSARLDHHFAVAGISGSALMTEQQVQVSFFSCVKAVVAGTAKGSLVLLQWFGADGAAQRKMKVTVH